MSNRRNPGCITCEARNRKCDRTRGPTGCRRCTKSGLECEGYLGVTWRVPKPKHNTRGSESQGQPTHQFEHFDPTRIAASIGSSTPNQPLRSGEINSTLPSNDHPVDNLDSVNLTSGKTYDQLTELYLRTHQLPTPSVGRPFIPGDIAPVGDVPAASIAQNPTRIAEPPALQTEAEIGHDARTRSGECMTAGQTSLLGTMFSLTNDPLNLSHAPPSTQLGVVRGLGMERGQSSVTTRRQSSDLHPNEPTVGRPSSSDDDDYDLDDSENMIIGLFKELSLDPKVESNAVPFVATAFTLWCTRFDFEAVRALSIARRMIVSGHLSGPKIYQKMMLLANTVFAISKSTNYELEYFMTLYKQLVKGVLDTRACSELTREAAMKAVGSCVELIPITSKVASLASVVNLVALYAPIFRRACPEPGDKLVNLPRRFTAAEIGLKYFISFDVIQSVLTQRPMFFRYDLEILSPQDDELLDADDRPGLRWSIGIPDRLMFALAMINTLIEEYGHCDDDKVVQEIEEVIARACKPLVTSGPTRDHPTLAIGRLVVRESWRLAGYVYLYMGLCGANSRDARVVKIQNQFMRLLAAMKPRRNPDSFLVLPTFIVGIATSSPVGQSTLLARLRGISECSKPGTMGNDLVRMLNDIWERTTSRPAVWSDLRLACLRVTGV